MELDLSRRAMLVAALALGLGACGGGSPTVAPTPTPAPPATIAASGNGKVEVHPALSTAWVISLLVPIRIQESAGGTASWDFARLSLFRDGVEVERGEIGADVLAAPPDWTSITAHQDAAYALVFGLNNEIDAIKLTLGFTDRKDGRQFTIDVPNDSFDGISISLVPLSRPAQSVQRLD